MSALAGMTALVTGGGRGIGLAVAKKLGRMGASVAVCARDRERLRQATEEMNAEGLRALAVPADLMDGIQIDAMVRQVESGLGPIDILVNNAGIGIFGALHERSDADWDAVLNTNLKAVFLASRAVIPGMISRRSGQIINISSLAGKNVFAGGGIYCASKWGLMGLTGCMAEELRGHGIRVSVVCPGSVATEFSLPGGRDRSKLLQPEDVAHAVAMLVTEGPQSFISEIDLRPRQKT